MNAAPTEIAAFDRLAHRFWDPSGEFRPLHLMNPIRLQFVNNHVALKNVPLLDVGCGGGLFAEALSRAGAQVTGIDLAPSMIEVARLHAQEQQLQIDYRVQAVETMPAAHFAVVTCMEMLEHVPQPAATVQALARCLRPGGSLFVSTINRNLKAFSLAIVAAEYLLRLIPRGTTDYPSGAQQRSTSQRP
jgi:2-polyprenyl-6-hydroxyphenyl methylase / 3-demethylubiquinone-9 3-methyltransferase